MIRISAVAYLFVFLWTSSLGAQHVHDPKLVVSNPIITRIVYDAEKDGTRIGMSFSVRDLDKNPVNGLKSGRNGNFRVFIDGVQETSFETLTENSVARPPFGITLVLDTSYSMEDSKALAQMKTAAERFVSRLLDSNSNFQFQYYQFATQVQKISGLKDISTKKAFGQFTSLYSALKMAIQDHPNNIILLFTDGADNKSPDNRQLSVERVEEVEALIQRHSSVIHTVKLGIEDSNDSKGVNNKEILSRLTVNGSLRYEAQPENLVRAFEEIASRVAYPYYFEYLCPRTKAGSYQILVQIDRRGVASQNSKWNPEVSFELPFELHGGDNRVFLSAHEAARKVIKNPILMPSYTRNAYSGAIENLSWKLMLWSTTGSMTKVEDIDGSVSEMSVFFRNPRYNRMTNEVTADVVYEGPSDFVKAWNASITNHDGVGPLTSIYQFNIQNGNFQNWETRSQFYPAKGLKFTDLGSRAEWSQTVTFKIQPVMGALTSVQVVASYNTTDNRKWYLSVKLESLFFPD